MCHATTEGETHEWRYMSDYDRRHRLRHDAMCQATTEETGYDIMTLCVMLHLKAQQTDAIGCVVLQHTMSTNLVTNQRHDPSPEIDR